jgi:F0F1-type ATP synthase assembly protein I
MMAIRPDEKDQDQRQGKARRQGLAYQGAFEAVAAIPIATGIGYWIDASYETGPYGVLIGATVGFAAFVLRLIRLGSQLQQLGDPALAEDEDQEA